jgi:hypothetical protein
VAASLQRTKKKGFCHQAILASGVIKHYRPVAALNFSGRILRISALRRDPGMQGSKSKTMGNQPFREETTLSQ